MDYSKLKNTIQGLDGIEASIQNAVNCINKYSDDSEVKRMLNKSLTGLVNGSEEDVKEAKKEADDYLKKMSKRYGN